jgi:hypothetical protein
MGGRAAMPGNGQWFEETDREGVAFEYDVIEMKATSVGGVRANMARRALRATSFLFLLRERNFGLAIRPARCKLVKDRGWVIR